ncbi:MAG: hypothetical protein JW839_01795 [Candidatus Lokiarchaeota archaeon]|nr:hypothetical protein [Candidatus Lokiarchaeota archaeon]
MDQISVKLAALPSIVTEPMHEGGDWLVDRVHRPAIACRGKMANELVITNGLVSRVFRVVPNGATVDIVNEMTGESLIRGVKPEARLTIGGKEHAVGGLIGQAEYAYLLREWLDQMGTDPSAFQLVGFDIGKICPRFPWKRTRHAGNVAWPPGGVGVSFIYTSVNVPGVDVVVHHELYDGIPLLCKWLELKNTSAEPVKVDTFTAEILAMVEATSTPQGSASKATAAVLPPVHVESDYIFAAMSPAVCDVTTRWVKDPQYTSQVAYLSDSPVQLESAPPAGPGLIVEPGVSFETFRTWILVHDGTDRERRGLAQRRMYRTIAP